MENFQHSIRLRTLFVSIFLISLLFLFSWIHIPNFFDNRSFEERFLERERDIECVGIIDSIYRQKQNHNILTLKINQCVYEIPSFWENKFQVGDSISKKKGQLVIAHYREGKLLEVIEVKL